MSDWETQAKKKSRAAIISIVNKSGHTLKRELLQPPLHGEWIHIPPETLSPGETARFGTVSKGFMVGTEAMVSYCDPELSHLGLLTFEWDAPFAGKNQANCAEPPTGYKIKKSHSGPGHTFYAEFTVSSTDKIKKVDSKTERVAVISDEWKKELKNAARSTLIAINNRTAHRLVRTAQPELRHGVWRRPAPEFIEANETVEFGSESDGVMIGTEGTVSYHISGDPKATIQLLWDNPFVGSNVFQSKVSQNAPLSITKYVNKGNDAEVVFDISAKQESGKAVFGVTYAEVMNAHQGAVLPPVLQQIVDVCVERGTSPANRGLFCGVASFSEVVELRNALIFSHDIDVDRFDPASLGQVFVNFLGELKDSPLKPFITSSSLANSDSQKQAHALLQVTLRLLAAVARDDEPAAPPSELMKPDVPAPPRHGLTKHELACLFVPVLMHDRHAAPDAKKQPTPRDMQHRLREFRAAVNCLTGLIDSTHVKKKTHHGDDSKAKKKAHHDDDSKAKHAKKVKKTS